ncbi:MAG: hypothetical protein ACTSW8_06595 [Candidatus Thorarchaeota archaeon]
MSQKLMQTVALVTYGNVFLRNQGREFDIDKLVNDNCYKFDFMELPVEEIAGATKILSSDAYKWFGYLKGQGAKKLKLFYKTSSHSDLPDHISTAFVGGGSQWIIEAQFETTSDLYLTEWYPTNEMGLDRQKIHCVRFSRDLIHLEDTSPSVDKSRERLSNMLQELAEFTGKFDYSKHWVDNFNNALTTLQEFEPSLSDEFLPAGIYSKDAHRLIQGAFSSWVFGGMGSFNDLSFSGADQELYESLSKNLYSILCNAIASGVNSYP